MHNLNLKFIWGSYFLNLMGKIEIQTFLCPISWNSTVSQMLLIERNLLFFILDIDDMPLITSMILTTFLCEENFS